LVLSTLLCSQACAPKKTEREAAQLLLDRISAIDVRASIPTRAAQIKRLRELPLSDTRLSNIRDHCALAHGGLLTAERDQSAVRARVDDAQRNPVDAAELEQLRAALVRAAHSLQDAHASLPECESNARRLVRDVR
jgi:hypothetical protein